MNWNNSLIETRIYETLLDNFIFHTSKPPKISYLFMFDIDCSTLTISHHDHLRYIYHLNYQFLIKISSSVFNVPVCEAVQLLVQLLHLIAAYVNFMQNVNVCNRLWTYRYLLKQKQRSLFWFSFEQWCCKDYLDCFILQEASMEGKESIKHKVFFGRTLIKYWWHSCTLRKLGRFLNNQE